jgi:hypothetical protein
MDGTTEYRLWIDMRRRCYQAHRPDYRRYGARGIYVCDRWRESFENFFADMGHRPDGHTLDRIDNDGPYGPENCRWVPNKVQGRNRRTNRLLSIFGETMTLVEAAERYGIDQGTVGSRLRLYGYTPEDAVTLPLDTHRKRRSRTAEGKFA